MAITWKELIKEDKAFAKAVICNAKNLTRQGKANLLQKLRKSTG